LFGQWGITLEGSDGKEYKTPSKGLLFVYILVLGTFDITVVSTVFFPSQFPENIFIAFTIALFIGIIFSNFYLNYQIAGLDRSALDNVKHLILSMKRYELYSNSGGVLVYHYRFILFGFQFYRRIFIVHRNDDFIIIGPRWVINRIRKAPMETITIEGLEHVKATAIKEPSFS
jgi:hypothetical protein